MKREGSRQLQRQQSEEREKKLVNTGRGLDEPKRKWGEKTTGKGIVKRKGRVRKRK